MINFKRGEKNLYSKERHLDEDFKSGEFLAKKFRAQVNKYRPIHHRSSPRGVKLVQVDSIICKLLPLMPLTYKICWQNFPSSLNAKDLTVNYDHLSKEKKKKVLPRYPEKECRAVNENFYFNSSFM